MRLLRPQVLDISALQILQRVKHNRLFVEPVKKLITGSWYLPN